MVDFLMTCLRDFINSKHMHTIVYLELDLELDLVSRARLTFRRLRGKSKSGHPLILFWCKCAGMLAHCSFAIKHVTSRTMAIRFR